MLEQLPGHDCHDSGHQRLHAARVRGVPAHEDLCGQLRAALDFAVDGDGFREKIEETLEAESCK